MLEFKKEYFQTETNRHLYPTTLDLSKAEVYGCKDREAYMYKIPNNRYTSNAGNIDFSLYPNGIWSDYTGIKIVERLPFFQPSINFNKLGDITPSNLNKLKEEIRQHIVDLETAITESVNFIDSGVPGQNNLPYLPEGCVWFRDPIIKDVIALPITDLYEKFGNLIKAMEKVLDEYIEQKKEEIRGPAGAIDNVTASVNSNAGTPKVTVSLGGTPERRKIDLKFENLKGDKPIKGADYYTPAEKEQFTNDTKAVVQAEGNKVIEQVKKLVGANPAGGDAVSVGGLTRPEIEKGINKNSNGIISTSDNLLFDKNQVFINKVNSYTTSTFSGFKSKVTIDKNRKATGVTVTLKARKTAITKVKFTVSLNNLLINEYIEDITIMPKTEKDVNVHFLKELDLKNGDILEIGYQCNQLCDGIFYRNKDENSNFAENYYTTNGIINDNWQLIGSDNKCIYYCFLEKYPIKKIKEIENNLNTFSKIKLVPNDINNFPLCNNDIPEKTTDKITVIIGYGFYINKTDLFKNGDLTGIKLNGFDIVKTDELEKDLFVEFIDQNNFKVLKSYKTKIKPNDVDNYFINCFIKKEELIELPEEMTLGIRTSVQIAPSYDSTFRYKEKNQLHNIKPDFENYYEYPLYYDDELKRWWPFSHLTDENYTCPNVEFLYSYGVVTDKKLSKINMPADSFIVGENIKRIDFDIKRIENNMSIKPKLLLKLPEKFDLVVGDTFELFYKGIINASNTDIYDISIDSSKNIGQAYKRKYVYTPKSSEIGERAVTFNLLDNLGNKLESQQVIFNIVDVPKNPTEIKNILCIGDSLSAYGVWINEFRKRLIGTSSHIPFNITNVNFIGTKEREGTMFEGYGGWTYNSYLTANISSDFMYIYGTFDKTEVDQHSVYKDSDGNQWKLETITPNKIKIIQISWISTLPSSGTLTWVSGGQNHSNIVYTSSEQAEGNPFWNANTKAVDFYWYAQKHKVSKIDYIYILLGWNETHKTTEQLTNDCKQLLNHILKDFPDCKIGLIGLQVPSQNGFGENYGTDWKYYDKLQHIWRLQEIYQTISKEPQYTGKVDYINISAQFDSEYNMPHEERNANIRTTQKEYVQTNGVHPANDGYMQIADAVLRNFLTKI